MEIARRSPEERRSHFPQNWPRRSKYPSLPPAAKGPSISGLRGLTVAGFRDFFPTHFDGAANRRFVSCRKQFWLVHCGAAICGLKQSYSTRAPQRTVASGCLGTTLRSFLIAINSTAMGEVLGADFEIP